MYLLTNIDESNEHFSMDPKEQLSAIKDIRQNGYQMIGNFHSHPESPSRPSEEDKRLAFDPNIEYLILSLMDAENPVLKAFGVDKEKNVTVLQIFNSLDCFQCILIASECCQTEISLTMCTKA